MPRVKHKGHRLLYGDDQQEALIRGAFGAALANRPLFAGDLSADSDGEVALPLKGPPIFKNLEEMRTAWLKHRHELMRPEVHDLSAGCRPWAWWKFDVGLDPVPERWCTEIVELLKLNLIDGTEALLIERAYLMLAPAAVVPSGPHCEAAMERSDPDLVSRRWSRKRRLAEAKCAAAWHRWRGREQQASSWEKTVAEVEAAMAADL